MRLRDAYSAKSIALVNEQVASNKIAYLGEGLFPRKKKAGLDLKWIKASKGLPVALQSSSFDTVSTIRSREGIKIEQTEMAYFKESMLVKEVDEQEILRVQEASDPYGQEVLAHIYDDAQTLVDGADVIPEIMVMSLLSSAKDYSGSPKISISSDGATYVYNYDPKGEYAEDNYTALSGTSVWSDLDDSDPIKDVDEACDAVEAKTGTRPSIMIVSKATMNLLKQNDKIKAYVLSHNANASVIMTDERVKEVFDTELGVTVIVYAKQYKDYTGTAKKFFPDGVATLLPEGALGNMWFGTTPDERTLLGDPNYDCAIVNTGVAVTVTTTNDPVHTKTTVSEICLPSFERISETYQINAWTPAQA